MMPAARGSVVAYSLMLEQSGQPLDVAHEMFERSLDAAPPRPSGELTVEDKRAQLEAALRGSPADITGRISAGALT